MLLAPGTRVLWNITLPPGTRSASLETAAGFARQHPASPTVGKLRLKISLQSSNLPEEILFRTTLSSGAAGWKPVRIPLDEYAGRTITLVFSETSPQPVAGGAAVFKFPAVRLRLSDEYSPPQVSQFVPENTELSPRFPKSTAADLLLSPVTDGTWAYQGVQPALADPRSFKPVPGSIAAFSTLIPLDAPLDSFSNIILYISTSRDISPYFIDLQFTTDKGLTSFRLPTLMDGRMHAYSIPIRLLQLAENSRLQRIAIFPIHQEFSTESQITFGGIRLVCAHAPTNAPTSRRSLVPGRSCGP